MLKRSITLYNRKNEIHGYKIDDSLRNVSSEMFRGFLAEYNNRAQHLIDLENAEKEHFEIKAEKDKIDSIRNQIKQIELFSFKNQNEITNQIIDQKFTRLQLDKDEINELINFEQEKNNLNVENILSSCDFDLQDSSRTHLLENQIILQKKISELKYEKGSNDQKLVDAYRIIEEVKLKYFETFKEKVSSLSVVKVFNPDVGKNPLRDKVSAAKVSFEETYKLAKRNTETNNSEDSYNLDELAHFLLPTVFKTGKINKELISDNIGERLNKLAAIIREIGSRKIEILKRVFDEVYSVYNDYQTQIISIDRHLKSRAITGGNRASLEQIKAIDYPISWMTPFRKQLAEQVENTGLFKSLKEEIDINEIMIKAFRDSGGTIEAEPEDLINPKSYFDLEFDLKLENGESNSGSNGQTYTGNALLAIARLSLIEEKSRRGIKIMPIDEAEGLGSNYKMLHELAKEEGYQIISMGIETTGDIIEGEQFIYILNENKIGDYESYVPPLAILSGGNITESIDDYIKNK